MLLDALQRKLDRYSRKDPTLFASLNIGTSAPEIEAWRERKGGVFGVRTGRRWWNAGAATREKGRDGTFRRGKWVWEPTGEWAFSPNIVTNEGLAYVIDVAFREVADIAPWYTVIYTDAGTPSPAAGDTYASPNHTEASGTNLDETVRQAWVDGSPSGTTTRSVAGAAVTYTGDNTFNAAGAAQKGGGTVATTLADTGGGGTMYCASNFGTEVPMTVDATVDVTYTLTATDDA
jgi:hypothetical protein